jgi:hypothetical protein
MSRHLENKHVYPNLGGGGGICLISLKFSQVLKFNVHFGCLVLTLAYCIEHLHLGMK